MSKTEALKAKGSLNMKEWNSAVDQSRKKTTAFRRVAMVSFKKAMTSAKKMGSGLVSMAKVGAVGIAATGAAMTALMRSTMAAGDEMDKMSKRTGLSAGFLSKLKYAADLGGTGINDMEIGIRRMQKTAFDARAGLKSAQRGFEELGIGVMDAGGNLKSTERLFMETSAALAKVTDNTKKAALAQYIFGRAGTKLLPMLAEGKKGLQSAMTEAEQLGYVWTNQTAKGAADLTDSMTRLWKIGEGLTTRFAVGLMPTVQKLTDGLAEWYQNNRQLVTSNINAWAKDFAGLIKRAAVEVPPLLSSLKDTVLTVVQWAKENPRLAKGLALVTAGSIAMNVTGLLPFLATGGRLLLMLPKLVTGLRAVAAANALTGASFMAGAGAAGVFAAKAAAAAAVAYGAYKGGEYIGKKTGFHDWAGGQMKGWFSTGAAAPAINRTNPANKQGTNAWKRAQQQVVQAQSSPYTGPPAAPVIHINNNGVGNMSTRDAEKITDVVRKAILRGKRPPLPSGG